MDLYDRLEQRITERFGSNRAFFQFIGIAPSSIYVWRKRGTIPDNEILEKLGEALGVSVAWIRTGEGPVDDATPRKKTEVIKIWTDQAIIDEIAGLDFEGYKGMTVQQKTVKVIELGLSAYRENIEQERMVKGIMKSLQDKGDPDHATIKALLDKVKAKS